MKHLGALFLALFLLPIFAAAEDLPKPITDFISSYNSYTEYYAVDPLPFDGWIDRGTYYGFLDGDAYFSVSID
ncbi:MAG: hypothetical protein IJL71_05620, partial [Oscillospiraceae bacterium]|nr:hypothetical protein [Oscillospiraceae bacterium]